VRLLSTSAPRSWLGLAGARPTLDLEREAREPLGTLQPEKPLLGRQRQPPLPLLTGVPLERLVVAAQEVLARSTAI
jgi:hypothetical protein